MNRMKGLVFLIIFGFLCILVVIQAGLNANEIKISEDKKEEIIWDIVFEPDKETNEIVVNYTSGVEFTMPQLFDSIVNDYDVTFTKPEEEITYEFNLVNKSEYDAYILHYNKTKLSCIDDNDLCISNLDKIDYSFKYIDGEEVKEKDIIKANETKRVIIKIKYNKNKEEIPMSLTKLGFNLTFAKVK